MEKAGYFPKKGAVVSGRTLRLHSAATNGDFYGTTYEYGANGNYGTAFKITPNGALTTLYSFCSQSGCTDGYGPLGGLVQATNGDLYGTTFEGGANGNYGTVFRITPSGALTTLYSFCSQSGCTDGEDPKGRLVQATDGYLYGTTFLGGAYGYGTVFRITPNGTLTTIYSFCPQLVGGTCSDGAYPQTALVQATNGDFYGTTEGGTNAFGNIFQISPSGTLTTLYTFCSQSGCPDGSDPRTGLVQDTNGGFYGTTDSGGTNGDYGTVFSWSVGLGPFVETRPTSGAVGATVEILGSDMTGATSVSFNGTAATFTVVSRRLITATVPTGATTGEVQVVTPSRTLGSNEPFRVLP